MKIHVIGAGLAGSEAAYFLARQGFEVHLHEMRPKKMTEAHQTGLCAELVCSNSFKSKSPTSAPGILKEEMRFLDSLVLRTAEECAVPGGEALTVDREKFSAAISHALESHENIQIFHEEVEKPFADAPTLIATGPLTSNKLSQWISDATESDGLYFYDAIAPIIDTSTIDSSKSFLANRYDKGGEAAYINCPLNEKEYYDFVDALLEGEKVQPKVFEKEKFYQACQPIEAIANGGRDSLRFGPMKPVGLSDPRTGERPFAVVQLRSENLSASAHNMVGFQTKLKYGEQKRIFQMIPALKNAEFLRFGSIHRNTYINGPKLLRADLSLKGFPLVYFGGQITGVEGYFESASSGLMAALFISQRLKKLPHNAPPANTALGALLKHILCSDPKNYQPNGIHFGLFEQTHYQGVTGLKRDPAREKMAQQSVQNLEQWSQLHPAFSNISCTF